VAAAVDFQDQESLEQEIHEADPGQVDPGLGVNPFRAEDAEEQAGHDLNGGISRAVNQVKHFPGSSIPVSRQPLVQVRQRGHALPHGALHHYCRFDLSQAAQPVNEYVSHACDRLRSSGWNQ